ncbi:MAG: PTS sugar transporter subunit IIA [Defluviitaleaceae bacterium]|nr:PTS sugar transporter subunit IIA [Defluviitaleaceae bacterium]
MTEDKKCLGLIKQLRETSTWTTCKDLAQKLNTTPRKVRYLIAKINSENNIIISSVKGYYLKEDEVASFNLAYSTSVIPTNYAERRKYIFEQLIIFNQSPDMDDLADYFCISPTTFKNELPNLKKELSNYGLYFKIRNGKISVIGSDKDRQKFALSLIRDEMEHSNFSLINIQQFFKSVNLIDIRQIVIDVFVKYEYFLDEYSLLNYVLHLAVCMEHGNSHNAYSESNEVFSDPDLIKIVEDISYSLKRHYEGSYTAGGIVEASILMSTRAIAQKSALPDFEDIEPLVGKKVKKLVMEIIDSVNETYSIDLKCEKLMVRFAMHLKNMLIRADKNKTLDNGQFTNIKKEHPFLHVIAVYVSRIIIKRTGYNLSEDEIAYIALHIGVMLEEQTVNQEKLSCVIFATDYHKFIKNIYKKLTQKFNDSLFIQNVYTSYDQMQVELDSIDLIVSTYELTNLSLPNIVISPFFNDSDVLAIMSKIENFKQLKRKNNILSKIEVFIREDLCFFGHEFKTPEDAIETMSNYMIKKKYVHSSFKKEIYAHERISPSSYGNIAIAHTLTDRDLSSHISISINPTPIPWGDNKVNIFFLISLNKKDRRLFKDIFKFLTEIVSNSQAFSNIMKTTSYGDLIDVFRFFL